MARNIFIVDAHIVDANGAFHFIDGYPKTFDSNNASYQGDVDKAKKRSEGDASEQWGAMCKQDTRQIQVVSMTDIFGNVYMKKSMGDFPENQPPEPEQQQ